MPITGLDGPCGACGRTSGDHTLREWAVCVGDVTTDLPFEPDPPEVAAALRERFGIPADVLIADHVGVRALTIEGSSASVDVRIPGIEQTFGIGVPGAPPATVAKVLYIGDVAAMRGFGRLLRDSANGAANAAEQ